MTKLNGLLGQAIPLIAKKLRDDIGVVEHDYATIAAFTTPHITADDLSEAFNESWKKSETDLMSDLTKMATKMVRTAAEDLEQAVSVYAAKLAGLRKIDTEFNVEKLITELPADDKFVETVRDLQKKSSKAMLDLIWRQWVINRDLHLKIAMIPSELRDELANEYDSYAQKMTE